MTLGRTAFLALVVIALSLSAFSQAKKPIKKGGIKPVQKSLGCASGNFSFKCPKGYRVISSGRMPDNLFFATSTKFDYALFVVAEPDVQIWAELIARMTKSFLPKESQDFQWKELEADSRKSSTYEVDSKRKMGFNGKTVLTLDIRTIDFNGKKLASGTIVKDGENGNKARFEDGLYGVSTGCFDSVDIIAAFTKEKVDHDKGPCVMTISIN
jgi:hypothetical protein